MSSTGNIVYNTDTHAQIDVTKKRLFLGYNEFDRGTFLEESGSDSTIKAGRLLGRIAGSDQLVLHDATRTDGGQFPVGVVSEDFDVGASSTKDIGYCIKGDVAENYIVLSGSQSLDGTVIGSGGTTAQEYKRTIRDAIRGETMGIRLHVVTDHTDHNNS